MELENLYDVSTGQITVQGKNVILSDEDFLYRFFRLLRDDEDNDFSVHMYNFVYINTYKYDEEYNINLVKRNIELDNSGSLTLNIDVEDSKLKTIYQDIKEWWDKKEDKVDDVLLIKISSRLGLIIIDIPVRLGHIHSDMLSHVDKLIHWNEYPEIKKENLRKIGVGNDSYDLITSVYIQGLVSDSNSLPIGKKFFDALKGEGNCSEMINSFFNPEKSGFEEMMETDYEVMVFRIHELLKQIK